MLKALFTFYKTSYLNEVNCTEASPSVAFFDWIVPCFSDDHDVVKLLTFSLQPAEADLVPDILFEEESKKFEIEFEEYQQKLNLQKEEWTKQHPDQVPIWSVLFFFVSDKEAN